MHTIASGPTLFSGVGWVLYIIWIVLVVAGTWKTSSRPGAPAGGPYPLLQHLPDDQSGRPAGLVADPLLHPHRQRHHVADRGLGVAENFGHGAGYGILLWLFAPIMFLVLGSGSDQYKPIRT